VAVSIHGPSSLPTKVRNVVLFTEIVESVRDALAPSLELEENDNDVPDLTVGAASVDWPVRPALMFQPSKNWRCVEICTTCTSYVLRLTQRRPELRTLAGDRPQTIKTA